MTVQAHPPICEACGTTANVSFHPSPAGGEHLCIEHTQQRALTDAAGQHLLALLNDTLVHWIQHWKESALSPLDLAEAADAAVIELDQLSFAARKAQIQELLKNLEGKQ